MKCIDGRVDGLTTGKHYRVLEVFSGALHGVCGEGGFYGVTDDYGVYSEYDKSRFEHSAIHPIMPEPLEPEVMPAQPPVEGQSLKAFITQLPVTDIRHKEYFDLLHRIEDLEEEVRGVQWRSC